MRVFTKRLITTAFAFAAVALAMSTHQSTAASAEEERIRERLEEIIALDSKGWLFNRFLPGSVGNVSVSDAPNAKKIVYGEYTFNRNRRGWIKVLMNKESVECIEYWDFRGICRPIGRSPSHEIASGLITDAFSMDPGAYGGGNAAPSDPFRDPSLCARGVIAYC